MDPGGGEPRVDPSTLTVRAGKRVWRFDVDLDTGAVVIDVDGAPRTLRPLRWGEKVTLARYATGRPDLVDSALIEGRLTASPPQISDPEARSALIALARWANGFDVGSQRSAEPLDLAGLTATGLAARQHAGLQPRDLDDRPALEVELLATLATLATPEFANDDIGSGPPVGVTHVTADGMTRIVVVPDPGQPDPDQPDAPAARQEPIGEPVPMTNALQRADDEEPPSDEGPPNPGGLGLRGAHSASEERGAPTVTSPGPPVRRGAEGAQHTARRRPALARVEATGARGGADLPFLGGGVLASGGILAAGRVGAADPGRDRSVSGGARALGGPGRIETSRRTPPAAAGIGAGQPPGLPTVALPTTSAGAARLVVGRPVGPVPAARAPGSAGEPVAWLAEPSPARTPPAAALVDVDALVAELTRRLERAVADQGLDPGD